MNEPIQGLDLDFQGSPTSYKFLQNDSFVRGLMGPVGCLAPETLVVTEHGLLPIAHIDRPMRVLSWNERTCRFQLSWCGGSFPKQTGSLYRIATLSGEFLAAANHRMLDDRGEYVFAADLKVGDRLAEHCVGREATTLELARVMSLSGEQNYSETDVDSLASYADVARQYGQQLQRDQDIDPASLPSLDGVREYIRSCACMGDLQEQGQERSPRSLFASRAPTLGCPSHAVDSPGLTVATHDVGLCLQHNGLESRTLIFPTSTAESLRRNEPHHTGALEELCAQIRQCSTQEPWQSPLDVVGNTIIHIQEIKGNYGHWDLQVLDTNNYVTVDGTIHHNSGKSYACAAEVLLRAIKQKPSPVDGIRYSRFVIVRNSYPELKTTTIKTWTDLFPESVWGPLRWTPPITHHIKLPSRGEAAGIDCEVIFLALDQPKDVRKLLSLELTGAWVNEARELPKAVIDGLTHRVGRYPTKRDGGATWHGIWMDTNPMDDDHWWHRLAEKERITGKYAWKFFGQPGGVIEVNASELPENPEANDHIFASNKWWKINPKAENIKNLPPGYYLQQLAGKNLDWIRCYAEGKYTYVQEGKPVWPEYDDMIMSMDGLLPDPSLPIQIGLDFGLTPAAVFGQRTPAGQWRILHELVTFDIGLERFGSYLLSEINSRFPRYEILIWGDPAGQQRDAIYETTAFEFLRTLGLRAQPTASNDFKIRREGAAAPMNRMVMGKPGLIVDKSCKLLRKSLAGGYHFKRIAVGAGQERFKDTPNKNEHSHVGDAFGYLCLGGGEFKHLTKSQNAGGRTFMAQTVVSGDFDPFSF